MVMGATNIQPGATLVDETNNLVYTVIQVATSPNGAQIQALVQFAIDGGQEWRVWDATTQVPLIPAAVTPAPDPVPDPTPDPVPDPAPTDPPASQDPAVDPSTIVT